MARARPASSVRRAIKRNGAVDIIVNCAAAYADRKDAPGQPAQYRARRTWGASFMFQAELGPLIARARRGE